MPWNRLGTVALAHERGATAASAGGDDASAPWSCAWPGRWALRARRDHARSADRARAGLGAGAISENLNSLVLTSSVLTIVITPMAFWVAPRVDVLLSRAPLVGRAFSAHPAVLAEDGSLFDHAVVIGYSRVGRHVTNGLRDTGMPVVVVEQDLHLVQELRAEGGPAIYGDVSYPGILAAAHPERPG